LVSVGEDRLFAGLADGELWESRDRGDTWTRCRLRSDRIDALLALAEAIGWGSAAGGFRLPMLPVLSGCGP
jgi:hypothetical protein